MVVAYSLMYSDSKKYYKGNFYDPRNLEKWNIIDEVSTKMYNPALRTLLNEKDRVAAFLQHINFSLTVKIVLEIFVFCMMCI
jgi:hypothetical protein